MTNLIIPKGVRAPPPSLPRVGNTLRKPNKVKALRSSHDLSDDRISAVARKIPEK
jgi:hypothetical protein